MMFDEIGDGDWHSAETTEGVSIYVFSGKYPKGGVWHVTIATLRPIDFEWEAMIQKMVVVPEDGVMMVGRPTSRLFKELADAMEGVEEEHNKERPESGDE